MVDGIPDSYAISNGFDLDHIKGANKDDSLKGATSRIRGASLPSSISTFVKPYLEGKDVYTRADKNSSKATPPEAEYAIAANFVARNADGNPFTTADTGQSESFLSDIVAQNQINSIKGLDLAPENEGNFGPGGISFG